MTIMAEERMMDIVFLWFKWLQYGTNETDQY